MPWRKKQVPESQYESFYCPGCGENIRVLKDITSYTCDKCRTELEKVPDEAVKAVARTAPFFANIVTPAVVSAAVSVLFAIAFRI